MGKMITIKEGEEQPVKCERCDGFVGYQLNGHLKTYYNFNYNSDGSFDHSFYGDYQPIIRKCITPSCPNCGNKLKFKVERK